MLVSPLVVDESHDGRLIRVVVPGVNFVTISLIDFCHVFYRQVAFFVPTFQVPRKLSITDQYNGEELISTELARNVLEVSDQLFVGLVGDLSDSLIRHLNCLFGNVLCIVPIKADFVAEDEAIRGFRIYQVGILGT